MRMYLLETLFPLEPFKLNSLQSEKIQLLTAKREIKFDGLGLCLFRLENLD